MNITGALLGVLGQQSTREGLWDFLGRRSVAANRVRLEEVRVRGAVEIINALRDTGGVFSEGGKSWSRDIRVPSPMFSPVPGITIIVREINGEVALELIF